MHSNVTNHIVKKTFCYKDYLDISDLHGSASFIKIVINWKFHF